MMDIRVAVEIGIIVAAIAVAIVAWVWSRQFSQLVKTSLANFTDIEEPEIVDESPVETTRIEAGEEETESVAEEDDRVDPSDDVVLEDTEKVETVEESQTSLETTTENRETKSQDDRPTDNIISSLPDSMAIAFVPKRSRRWKGKRQQQPIAKLRQRMGAKQRRFKAIGVRRQQP